MRLSGALMLRILSLREFEAVREALPCRASLRVDWVQPNKTVATVATLEAMPGLLQHGTACAPVPTTPVRAHLTVGNLYEQVPQPRGRSARRASQPQLLCPRPGQARQRLDSQPG